MSSAAQNIVKLNSAGDGAPTPQNTPAAHLSHSALSRPQIPSNLSKSVVEADEEDEDDDIPVVSTTGANATNAALAGLTAHPAFASMVQDRLGDLVGRSSGYIESLPLPVRRRIIALKGLQQSHQAVEAEFQIAIFELEKSFLKKFEPIYTRRKELIAGGSEPKSEEIEEGEKVEDREEEEERDEEDEDEDEDEEREPREHSTAPTAAELSSAPKGIPEFWLTSLKNHLGLSELITERDEEALKHLIDLRISYPDTKPGFILTFEFGKDAKKFFKNNVLVKTYYYQDVVGEEGDFVYDRAEGTKIDWVEGKDLTTRVETKKQRNKNTNQTRIVKKVVPTDSFFSFFSPPQPPSDDSEDEDEEEVDEDIDEKLELDYQIGEDLKERVIPHAIDFFTGKALRQEQSNNYDSQEDDYSDEEESEDDDEDDDDDEDIVVGGKKGRAGAKRAPIAPATPASQQDPQECKQQ